MDMEEVPLTRIGQPTVDARSKATKIIAGAAAAIRQYLISINGNCRVQASMMPNTPIEYPHYLACRVGSNQQNPSEVTYFKVPHPAHFLVSCIQQISLATATIDRLRGSNVNSDVSGHVNHRNSQTRLLRLCVSLLIMSGQDDLRRSNAVWFERFKDQFILLRPSFVAEGCLTERLGLDAARWEAGIKGRGNDGRHVHALELRYSSAFRHVRYWVSHLLLLVEVEVVRMLIRRPSQINAKEPGEEPPTCFTRVVNEPVREGDVLLYYEVGGPE